MIEKFEIDQNQIDEFSELLKNNGNIKPGVLMNALITKVDNSYIFVDVGLKSEGRIPKEEFMMSAEELPKTGESITVLLESLENKDGNISLSYTKAMREKGWGTIEEFFQKRTPVSGEVVRRVSGGCIVNLEGVSAFLPKTQFPADLTDVKDLFGKNFQFMVIKMDRAKSNILVSLKNMNDSESASNFAEGQSVQGVVKTIADAVAFVDIGGVSARLHVSELSWERVNNISDVIKVGDKIDAKIVSISSGSRISISMKELKENPWEKEIKALNVVQDKIYKAKIQSVDQRMLIVELQKDVVAMVKASDVAWMKRYQTLNGFKKGQEIEVKVIEIDGKKSKIFASIKHVKNNNIKGFLSHLKVGDKMDCKVVAKSELGYVAQIADQIDGVIPKAGSYVSGTLNIDDKLSVYIVDLVPESGHIFLGMNKK